MLDVRKEIIDFFEKEIFACKGNVFQKKKKNQKKNQKKKESKNLSNNENESKSIDYDLFKKHFNFAVPSALVKQL